MELSSPISCLIIDDEPDSAAVLRYELSAYENIKLLNTCLGGKQGVTLRQQGGYDGWNDSINYSLLSSSKF